MSLNSKFDLYLFVHHLDGSITRHVVFSIDFESALSKISEFRHLYYDSEVLYSIQLRLFE